MDDFDDFTVSQRMHAAPELAEESLGLLRHSKVSMKLRQL